MRQSIAVIEKLEDRQLLTAGPTATFLQYVKGTGSSRIIAVLYDGPQTIGRATLNSGDIRVTSDQEYDEAAVFLGAIRQSRGTGLIAQYRVDGVGSGLFSLEMLPHEVSDANGAFVPAGIIGSFKIGPQGQASLNPFAPSVQVIGTTHGSSENPPPIDTSFGPVVRAVNLGGDALTVEGSTGVSVPFDSQTATLGVSRKKRKVATSPINISITAGAGNVYSGIAGDNPLYETEIFTPSYSSETLTITGLDPAHRYHIQFLHGDNRPVVNAYVSTPQTFSLPTGQFATTPLEFDTNEENQDSNTAILVSGTTSVTYNMPECPTRRPSFSGVVIEIADVIPTSAPAPSFIRNSIRLSGTAQLFDIVYPPLGNRSTAFLAAPAVQVGGPRGFSAIASLVHTSLGKDGLSVIATYRLEGIDMTGSYTISLGASKIATATFFHLRPIIWA